MLHLMVAGTGFLRRYLGYLPHGTINIKKNACDSCFAIINIDRFLAIIDVLILGLGSSFVLCCRP